MPATKRTADSPIASADAKKRRNDTNIFCDNEGRTDEKSDERTREELIESIKCKKKLIWAIDKTLDEIRKARNTTLDSILNSGGRSDQRPEDKVAEHAARIRDICAKEIKKQRKWQPSCKKGTTIWSYQGTVPNVQVFEKLFNIPAGAKAFKAKRLSWYDFTELFGCISASMEFRTLYVIDSYRRQCKVRYRILGVTGKHVNLKWDSEESTFQLSGTYGV